MADKNAVQALADRLGRDFNILANFAQEARLSRDDVSRSDWEAVALSTALSIAAQPDGPMKDYYLWIILGVMSRLADGHLREALTSLAGYVRDGDVNNLTRSCMWLAAMAVGNRVFPDEAFDEAMARIAKSKIASPQVREAVKDVIQRRSNG